MSEQSLTAVIGLYDGLPRAVADFEKLLALETDLVADKPFDAAVASKGDDGDVRVQQEHIGLHSHLGTKGAGVGLATGLLASLFPAVGLAGIAVGAAAGAATGGIANLRIDHARHKAFVDAADEALGRGESLLGVVCLAEHAEQFDQWMTGSQRVVQLDLDNDTASGS